MSTTPRSPFRIAPSGPNNFVLRENGDVLAQLTRAQTEQLGAEALAQLGWTASLESGIRVEDREPRQVPRDALEKTIASLRANGVPVEITEVIRTALRGPWRADEGLHQRRSEDRTGPRQPTPVRRHVKEVATKTPAKAPTKGISKADERKVRVAEREAQAAMQERGIVTSVLFDDREEQLRYEVRHFYLHSVPTGQRDQWPLQDYVLMDCFLDDLELQGEAVSRQQMLSVIVDIVCNRVWDVQSRQARAKREGSGAHTNPQIVRSFDGALAWRANVSTGTPAARRVMWWQRPDSTIELCRLTVHEDFEMPER